MNYVPQDRNLAEAYRVCRSIAKREAKNFYYGFLALPRVKSDAMCAIYAFMRRADDISDDESMPVAERRSLLARWLSAFHTAQPFHTSDAPVFLAVRDVQQQFGISDELLDQLVQGTAMDLSPEPPASVQRVQIRGREIDAYHTVAALESYCYLVASVVGLVTIRIFGYSDPGAEAYAVNLGKAFQFTNILRDVKEDAERGRVYLPIEVLEQAHTSVDAVVSASSGAAPSPELITALRNMGARATQFYDAAHNLIPLLEPDSRPAMRVLVDIYYGLLKEMERANYQVFARRIRVSTPRKITILLRGLLSSIRRTA